MRRTIPKALLHYALRLPHGRLKGSQVAMPKEAETPSRAVVEGVVDGCGEGA